MARVTGGHGTGSGGHRRGGRAPAGQSPADYGVDAITTYDNMSGSDVMRIGDIHSAAVEAYVSHNGNGTYNFHEEPTKGFKKAITDGIREYVKTVSRTGLNAGDIEESARLTNLIPAISGARLSQWADIATSPLAAYQFIGQAQRQVVAGYEDGLKADLKGKGDYKQSVADALHIPKEKVSDDNLVGLLRALQNVRNLPNQQN